MSTETEAAINDLTRSVLALAVTVEVARRDKAGKISSEGFAERKVIERFRSFDGFLIEEFRRRSDDG